MCSTSFKQGVSMDAVTLKTKNFTPFIDVELVLTTLRYCAESKTVPTSIQEDAQNILDYINK